MTVQRTHYYQLNSFTGNECRTARDNVKFTEPDPVTLDLEEVTCKACKEALIKRGVCPCCGMSKLTWGTHPRNKSGVANGRLTMNDVETIFYLACDYCSETVISRVDPEVVAQFLTGKNWTP